MWATILTGVGVAVACLVLVPLAAFTPPHPDDGLDDDEWD